MATPKGKLAHLRGRGNLGRPLKMVKMISAHCQECDPHGTDQRHNIYDTSWIETCPHDPYMHREQRTVVRPKIEERDGKEYIVGDEVEVETWLEPNWTQLPDDEKIGSGGFVAQAVAMGYKFPDELGFAPFCDYKDCWAQNPKFRTRYGAFCRRDEAALLTLRSQQKPTYVNIDTDADRLREQLENVNVREA